MMEVEQLEVGEAYRLRHSRFGHATVEIVKIVVGKELDDPVVWVDVKVLGGTLRGIGVGAVWNQGDTKRVRLSHCVFLVDTLE